MGMKHIYLLSEGQYEGVESVNVTTIKELNSKFTPKKYDVVIFTSKNAICCLNKIYREWKNIPAYSIGEGTSRVVKELGGEVAYEAKSSYGDEFAKEIVTLLSGKSVLFPRAKKVVSNVSGVLKNAGVDVHELILYESICEDKEIQIPCNDAVFIFTAPSIVRCFLKRVKWRDSFTAVAIGKKTSAAFPIHIKPYISPKQSIEACVSFAKTLSENNI